MDSNCFQFLLFLKIYILKAERKGERQNTGEIHKKRQNSHPLVYSEIPTMTRSWPGPKPGAKNPTHASTCKPAANKTHFCHHCYAAFLDVHWQEAGVRSCKLCSDTHCGVQHLSHQVKCLLLASFESELNTRTCWTNEHIEAKTGHRYR